MAAFRALIVVSFLAGAVGNAAAGEEQCLGGILPEGKGVQFCYGQDLPGGWSVYRADMSENGLMIAEFVIMKDEKNWFTVQLYDRSRGESLRSASETLSMLLGLKRIKKSRKGYLLMPKRRKRKRVAELATFKDKRYFVVVRRRKGTHRKVRAAKRAFIDGLEVHYTDTD